MKITDEAPDEEAVKAYDGIEQYGEVLVFCVWRFAQWVIARGVTNVLSKEEQLAVARLWAAKHNIELPLLWAQKGGEDEN